MDRIKQRAKERGWDQATLRNALAQATGRAASARIYASNAQTSGAPAASAKQGIDSAHAVADFSNALVELSTRGMLDNHPLPPPRGAPVPFSYVPIKTELNYTTTFSAGQIIVASANLWTPRRPLVVYFKTGEFATDGTATHQDLDAFTHTDTVTSCVTPNNLGDLDPPTMGGNAAGTGFYQPLGGRLVVEVVVPYAGHATAAALTTHPRLFGVEAGPDYTNEQGTLNNTGLIQYKTIVNSADLVGVDTQAITGSTGRWVADIPLQNHQGENWMKFTQMAHAGAAGNDESRMGSLQDAITYGGPAVRLEGVTGNFQVRFHLIQYGFASVHESSPVASLAQRHTTASNHGGAVTKPLKAFGDSAPMIPSLTRSGIVAGLTTDHVRSEVSTSHPSKIARLSDAVRGATTTAHDASGLLSDVKGAMKEVSSFGRMLWNDIKAVRNFAKPAAKEAVALAPLVFSV